MKTLPRNNFYKIISCIYNQVLNWMRCLYGFFFVNNYKCEICNNKYCSKYNLARHIKESHNQLYACGSSTRFREILEMEKLA
jgi:hypothetical protein